MDESSGNDNYGNFITNDFTDDKEMLTDQITNGDWHLGEGVDEVGEEGVGVVACLALSGVVVVVVVVGRNDLSALSICLLRTALSSETRVCAKQAQLMEKEGREEEE